MDASRLLDLTLAHLRLSVWALCLGAAISLPLASLWVWALAALALRELHEASWPRAILASFAGLAVTTLPTTVARFRNAGEPTSRLAWASGSAFSRSSGSTAH